METISRKEAMNYLINNGVAVHCDAIKSGWKYVGFYDADMVYSCYLFKGCVIIKHDHNDNRVSLNIHQISDNADVCFVWKYLLESKTEDNAKRNIMIYAYAPLPNKLSDFLGFRKFTRKGKQYDDSTIRKMTNDDEAIIKNLCGDSLNNDSHFGKCEAETFYSWIENDMFREQTLLGVFNDDNLMGLVSVNLFEDVELAQVADLYVHKNYRQHGYGKRLVKAALALYPNTEYFYQSAKQNTASIELAKSLGFSFAGAELYALDEW